MVKQFILTVLTLIPSLIITGLAVLWIRRASPSVLGYELPDLAFVIFYVTSFSLVYSLVSKRLFRAIGEGSKKEHSPRPVSSLLEGSASASSVLILTRSNAYVDRLRAYQVLIDGLPAEQIVDGGKNRYKLTPGIHEIAIRIDWCETKPLRFSIGAGEAKNLSCGSNLDGIGFLMLPWYVTLGRQNYLWLREQN